MPLTQHLALGSRQSAVWQLVAAFVISGAICSAIARILGVYVLGWHDSKFEQSPSSAIQVGLWDIGLSLVLATVVFALVLKARIRRGRGGSIWLAVILGAVYPIGYLPVERALMHLDPESALTIAAAIAYVVLFPAIAAFGIKKSP